MRYQIENDRLTVEIDAHGAELRSVRARENGQEFMWQADPKYWGRTSPVLFPFVGGLQGKEYRYQGRSYPMGQHGFARDMDFALTSRTENEIWFSLSSTEETMEKYPFPFVLRIGYRLEEDRLSVRWLVENPADTPLYFSIGAHPAFNCPIHGEADKTGYRLRFGGLDAVHHYGNPNPDGLAQEDEDLTLELQEQRAVITSDFFDRCTYMVPDRQTSEVALEDPSGAPIVTVRFDMPLFAIWSPEGKNAPFICIEPWCGRCDRVGYDGSLEERAYGNRLAGHETFETGYEMRFTSKKE